MYLKLKLSMLYIYYNTVTIRILLTYLIRNTHLFNFIQNSFGVKKLYLFVLFLVAFLGNSESVFATHAAGGELIYDLIPNTTNQYRFTFKFYRDCSGTAEPATFTMCYNNTCGVNNQSVTLSKMIGNLPNGQPNGSTVVTGCVNQPTICTGGALPGYREWWYTGVVTLNSTCNFWRFWITLCCRNNGIGNLVNSGAQNIFVETTFNNVYNLNSSPFIVTPPIAYYCQNQPSFAYYAASDPNGDSLTYESFNPQTNGAGCGVNAPVNIFQAPYNTVNPFPTGNTFTINPTNGLINFTPTALGKWVFTVKIKEYRNGVLIGSVMRDIQFVVTVCNLPNPLYVLAQYTPINCNGGTSTITATGFGGLPAYEYKLNLGAYQPGNQFTGLAAGVYTVTIKDAQNCTATSLVNIMQSPPIQVGVAAANILCNGGTTTIFCTGIGGLSPYQYSLNGAPFQLLNQFTNVGAGIYTITVKDANNCTGTNTISIIQSPPLNIAIVAPPLACNGLTTITTNVNGGVAPYQYKLNAGLYQIGNQFFNIGAGTYTITVKDANNCTNSTTLTILPINLLSLSTLNLTNPSCNGLCNGTAQFAAAGGTPAYVYSITAPGIINPATGAVTGLCAGAYTVTVTDANLCTAISTFTVTQPPPLSLNLINAVNPSCNGGCNGTAQVLGNGGVSPLLYSITAPGVINITGSVTGLCAGSYTVTVTDANLCTATTVLTITQPPPIVLNVSNIVNLTCFGLCNGTAQIGAVGGVPGFSYTITAPGIINFTGAASQLCAGTYTVTATDANLCTATTSFTVTQPLAVVANVSNITNVSCNGICDGTAQAGAVGGTPGYTFAITAPGVIDVNTGAITALCAGTYTVTVTDANNCTGTSTFTITEPNVLTITINTSTIPSCVPGCDGTATTITAGGTAAYAYSISGGAAINALGNATNLCAATVYTITVTDANNCTATTTIQLTAPNAPTVTVSNITNVTCNGLCNGTAQANGVGGLNPLSYTITAPGVIDVNTGAITGLCAGTYTVTVTDANLCTGTTSFTITEPALLTVSMSNIIDATCNGLCNGSAQATGLGGTNPLSYTITAPGVIDVNTGAATALCAGTYTVTVTDGNLCTATTSFTINEPTAVVTTVTASTNPTCTPGCDGSVTVSGSGGTGLIVFSIIPNAGIIQNPAGTFTGLCAGTNYVITGTDANGCTGTTNISLSTPNAPTANVSNITNVSCNGVCDGTAQAGAVGGTPGYTYAITAPGVIDINTGAITALCAGTYTVTVTDANNCTGTSTFTITEPNVLTITINTSTIPSCVPGCDGTATTITAGGTAAYAYSISGGAAINALGNATNLCAATVYTITVTDANNCTATTTIQLTAPNAPTVTVSNITNVTCNGLCNGTAQANGVGGLNPLSYTITAPGVIDVNTGAITGLCAGTYTVTVTDANLCTGTTSFTITEPTLLTVSMSNIIDATCNGLCNGSAQATGLGGTNPLSYTITAPGVIDVNTGAATALCAGTYTVTVTDGNLCTATTSFTINEPTAVVTTVTAKYKSNLYTRLRW